MKNAFLIGDKIYLRPLEREDAAVCQAYINDPDVRRTLRSSRPTNFVAEETWIAGQGRDAETIVLGVALKQTDRLIGATDLREIDSVNRRAYYGLSIGAKDEWHNGYGTEATQLMLKYGFATLNLHRIALTVYANNPYAVRAYQKAGFVLEGTLRKDIYRDGCYIDSFHMAILRDEWDRLTQKNEECSGLTNA